MGAVGSTNTEAMELAQNGDAGQLWVTATEQLAGKARRGRSWVSKPGNLYASLLLIDPAPADQISNLPLVVSVALFEALCSVAPLRNSLSIKWPNDLLLDGKKLSGLLLEASSDGHGRNAVVIGCGINCLHAPDNPMYPATSLRDEGYTVGAGSLFGALAIAMERSLRLWDQGRGFTSVRQQWLERAKGIGEHVTARFSDGDISGRFENMDEQGRLVLKTDNGTVHHISAADIFFGTSPSNES